MEVVVVVDTDMITELAAQVVVVLQVVRAVVWEETPVTPRQVQV